MVHQSERIIGRDGGYSALVFGHSAWAFGDTIVTQPDANGDTFHGNSFSLTADLDASDGLGSLDEPVDAGGSPLWLFPPTVDEAVYNAAHHGDACREPPCGARWIAWPGPIVPDPSGGALVFYGLIHGEPGDFNFYGVGQSLARWTDPSHPTSRPEVGACPGYPTLLFCQDEPSFGSAAIVDGDHLYAFACDRHGLDFPCRLGRVLLSAAFDRTAWRFWNGHTWTASLGEAGRILNGASIMGVFYSEHLRSWVAVHSTPLSNEVVYHTAPALTGPWTGGGRLFIADRRGQDGWTYDALPHPEIGSADGSTLYVTFSRPNGQGWFGADLVLMKVQFE
jgi:hypothetical protein